MKKSRVFVSTILLVISLVLTMIPFHSAAARPFIPVGPTGLTPGNWIYSGITGREVTPDTISSNYPAYMVPLTNALVLDGAARICHEFRGKQFGWTGEIFKLNGDIWQKMDTTINWVENFEGPATACADAPSNGTYILLGFWTKPANWFDPCLLTGFLICRD